MLYVLNNEGFDLIVEVKVKKVQNISSVTTEEGIFEVLAIQGIAKKNGKLIRTGDLSELLPSNELGINLKELWKYNQNYLFGTNNQMKILEENGIEFAINKKLNLKEVITKLKENKLLVDRGVEFGKRTLVNPLPKKIIDLVNSLK